MKLKNIEEVIAQLGNAIQEQRKITFILGSGISLPTGDSKNGLNGVNFFIEKLKSFQAKKYETNKKLLQIFNDNLERASAKGLSELYVFLAKEVSKEEVERMYAIEILSLIEINYPYSSKENFNEYVEKQEYLEKWKLNQGLQFFGKISKYLNPQNVKILTSNFDPFLEIEIRKNEIQAESVGYPSDYQTHPENHNPNRSAIRIEHYHGIWSGDTAHYELGNRKGNTAYIKENYLKKSDYIFVIGFGGWEDSATDALVEYVKSSIASSKIHWCFFESENDCIQNKYTYLKEKKIFEEDINFYENIDSNILFPKLLYDIESRKLIENLKEYFKEKSNRFKDSKEKFFRNLYIEQVSYKYGNINNRDGISDKNIIDFIKESANEGYSIILCSKFGLGKTHILQNVFLENLNENKYAIFINLAHTRLSQFSKDNIPSLITDELYSILGKNCVWIFQAENALTIIDEYLKEKKVTILLDGIDESIYNINDLKKVKDYLTQIEEDYPIITTTRLEFHSFFDEFSEGLQQYRAIEILEWEKAQIDNYFDKLSLSLSEEQKKTSIDVFKDRLKTLQTLSKRPIYIEMLTSLAIQNQTLTKAININDNISELYYLTITLSIDAIIESMQYRIEDRERLKSEFFDLLNQIAISIYLEVQKYKSKNFENTKFISKVSFNFENLRLLKSRYKLIDSEILDFFLNSTDNKIIKKIFNSKLLKETMSEYSFSQPEYSFSHRSYFEYLVANGAAYQIFTSKKCSDAWEVFQTDEVSQYFIDEVSRWEKRLDSEKITDALFHAFKNELQPLEEFFEEHNKMNSNYNSEKNLVYLKELYPNTSTENRKLIIEYTEKLEEVIYYIGKYKSKFDETQTILFKDNILKIFKYKDLFHPVFFRTSSITLSRLDNNYYIFNYLSRIILDFTKPGKVFFESQKKRDIEYYGKEELKIKCLEAYERVVNNSINEISPLDILKLFSLFISVEYKNDDEISQVRQQLQRLKQLFLDNCNEKLYDLIEGIKFIVEELYPLKSINKISNINELILEAIQKRINKISNKNNLIRLVNSDGDKLPKIFVDYYDGHIIIDNENEKIDDEIKNKIKESIIHCGLKIESISIKESSWHHRKQKSLIEIELIHGKKEVNELIECSENQLKILVDFRMSKTGFFIDNRNIREFLKDNSDGLSILNLCSFTCTLSVIALQNGAKVVINVEKRSEYLELGKKIYQENKIPFDEKNFINEDIDNFLMNNYNLKFDLIILDLPELSLIPCNFDYIRKIYRDYNEKAIKMLNDGGTLITSCCSHGYSRQRFESDLETICKSFNINFDKNNCLDKLDDHPTNYFDFEDYLKIYFIRK